MQNEELREVCGLPEKFQGSSLSWVALVQHSPYPKSRDALTEDRFDEPTRPCARFILRELDIRGGVR